MSGATTDKLVLQLSEDYYQGDAQFTVTVDAVNVTPTNATVTQRHYNNAATVRPTPGRHPALATNLTFRSRRSRAGNRTKSS